MNELILEWLDAGQVKTWRITDQAGVVRIGRDPSRCHLVLTHPTVSGMHVDVSFNPQRQQFILRNLRDSNPPLVNGQLLNQPETPLTMGDQILLGDLAVTVQQCNLIGMAPVQGSAPAYGLSCPRCQRVSGYDRLDLGCPWCGTSLASAASVLLP